MQRRTVLLFEEFAVGMGPKLFGVRRGETEYTLRLLPLGGACMMLGEDTAEEVIPGSFNSKSVWARMAVVAAGPVFNFIMAFVCAVIIIGMNGYISGEILQVRMVHRPWKPALKREISLQRRTEHLCIHFLISECILH